MTNSRPQAGQERIPVPRKATVDHLRGTSRLGRLGALTSLRGGGGVGVGLGVADSRRGVVLGISCLLYLPFPVFLPVHRSF